MLLLSIISSLYQVIKMPSSPFSHTPPQPQNPLLFQQSARGVLFPVLFPYCIFMCIKPLFPPLCSLLGPIKDKLSCGQGWGGWRSAAPVSCRELCATTDGCKEAIVIPALWYLPQ